MVGIIIILADDSFNLCWFEVLIEDLSRKTFQNLCFSLKLHVIVIVLLFCAYMKLRIWVTPTTNPPSPAPPKKRIQIKHWLEMGFVRLTRESSPPSFFSFFCLFEIIFFCLSLSRKNDVRLSTHYDCDVGWEFETNLDCFSPFDGSSTQLTWRTFYRYELKVNSSAARISFTDGFWSAYKLWSSVKQLSTVPKD